MALVGTVTSAGSVTDGLKGRFCRLSDREIKLSDRLGKFSAGRTKETGSATNQPGH